MNLKVITNIVKDPSILLRTRFPGCIVPDEVAISTLYYKRFNRKANLRNPQSFNEKVLWLTLHDRKQKYSIMVDKYRAKEYIAAIIGEGYTARSIKAYKSSSQINYDELPSKYVLKCNHDSGSVVICNGVRPTKKQLNNLDRQLKKNYFWFSREWYYKDVEPLIFAEEYIEGPSEDVGGLVDYKVYCFDGTPYMTCVISNRAKKANLTFMDMTWNKLNVKQRYENHKSIPIKPDNFDNMIWLAKKLSAGIPFLRVDFLEDANKRLYVGELTFTPSSGMIPFEPDSFDYVLGSKLDLGLMGG